MHTWQTVTFARSSYSRTPFVSRTGNIPNNFPHSHPKTGNMPDIEDIDIDREIILEDFANEELWTRQTESDLRTMLECEKIEKDPKRLAKVQALAKQKLIDLAGIASEGSND